MTDAIYLDANASEPPLEVALRAAERALAIVGNPSSPHAIGRRARLVLDEARDAVGAMLGARPRDVVFTSGASEGNRFVVDLLRGALPPGSSILTTTMEHPSLAKPLAVSGLHSGSGEGAFAATITTAAHNETGLLVDIDAVCRRMNDDVIVCVDAAQSTARLPPSPDRVDVIVCSAHKLGGLPGSGAIVVRGNARKLVPPWSGGGQEAGLRPGTENLIGIAAFGAAAAVIADTRKRAQALSPLRDRIERELAAAWGARVLGGDQPRLPQTSALVVPGVDGEALRIAIDLSGVCVGFGAACSALAPEPSPALQAMGLTAAEARATVRVSLPLSTTAADIEAAIARLRDVPHALRRNAAR